MPPRLRLTSSLLFAAASLLAGPFAHADATNSETRAQLSDTDPSYARLATLPLPELKSTLERAGWPPSHVQAILNAEIQRRLNPPFEPRATDLRPFEFWRTGPDALPLPPSTARAHIEDQQRRDTAAREAYDSLFPPDSPVTESPALAAWNDLRQWGDLPIGKRKAVAARLARSDRARDALFQPRGGMLSRDEWTLAWKIAEDARADLAKILTSTELLDFDLRNSVTAERMRSELDNFQPTRDEFLGIFTLRHAVELAFGHKPPDVDAAIDRQRAAAGAALEEKLAALLGPARHADYLLSLQPACQTLQFDGRFARADATAIRGLYRSLLATKEKLAALPDAEKSARTAGLKAALYAEFRRSLDDEGTRRYLQEQSLWP